MPKKLREEVEMAAISEIMEEARRVILDSKLKEKREREEMERKLREEEEEAKA